MSAKEKLSLSQMDEDDLFRMFAKARVDPVTGCWEWTASGSVGYGHITIKRHTQKVHRVSYHVFNGPLIDGLYVIHKCDNGKCFNPDHLTQGTPKDNSDDRDMKGRRHILKGDEFGRRKLSQSQVDEIRASDLKPVALGKIYGVNAEQIRRIIRRESWS